MSIALWSKGAHPMKVCALVNVDQIVFRWYIQFTRMRVQRQQVYGAKVRDASSTDDNYLHLFCVFTCISVFLCTCFDQIVMQRLHEKYIFISLMKHSSCDSFQKADYKNITPHFALQISLTVAPAIFAVAYNKQLHMQASLHSKRKEYEGNWALLSSVIKSSSYLSS